MRNLCKELPSIQDFNILSAVQTIGQLKFGKLSKQKSLKLNSIARNLLKDLSFKGKRKKTITREASEFLLMKVSLHFSEGQTFLPMERYLQFQLEFGKKMLKVGLSIAHFSTEKTS